MSANSSSRSSSDHGPLRQVAGLGEPRHVSGVWQTTSCQRVVMPPSTAKSAPVAKAPSSLARNTMMPSTSAGAPAPTERDPPDDRGARLGVGRDRRHERRLGVARDDGVHTDAAIGICRCDRPREPVDAGLRGAVGGEVPALAVQPGGAAGEDDRPARAAGEHRAHRVLDREERAGEVDVDRALPHVEIEVGGRGVLAEQLHARVGDDDVRRPARARPARRTRASTERLVGDVHDDGDRAVRADRRDRGSRRPRHPGRRSTTRAPSRAKRSRDGSPMPVPAPVTSAVFPSSLLMRGPQRSMWSRCSIRARFLSSSSSRKIFFQSSLMMLSRP